MRISLIALTCDRWSSLIATGHFKEAQRANANREIAEDLYFTYFYVAEQRQSYDDAD